MEFNARYASCHLLEAPLPIMKESNSRAAKNKIKLILFSHLGKEARIWLYKGELAGLFFEKYRKKRKLTENRMMKIVVKMVMTLILAVKRVQKVFSKPRFSNHNKSV
jgi:uncharacterized membrane protein YbaN (DUF454 family)